MHLLRFHSWQETLSACPLHVGSSGSWSRKRLALKRGAVKNSECTETNPVHKEEVEWSKGETASHTMMRRICLGTFVEARKRNPRAR